MNSISLLPPLRRFKFRVGRVLFLVIPLRWLSDKKRKNAKSRILPASEGSANKHSRSYRVINQPRPAARQEKFCLRESLNGAEVQDGRSVYFRARKRFNHSLNLTISASRLSRKLTFSRAAIFSAREQRSLCSIVSSPLAFFFVTSLRDCFKALCKTLQLFSPVSTCMRVRDPELCYFSFPNLTTSPIA